MGILESWRHGPWSKQQLALSCIEHLNNFSKQRYIVIVIRLKINYNLNNTASSKYKRSKKHQQNILRQINGLGSLTYKQRLEKLDLTTLLERRARGDLIETYKILSGKTSYGQNMFRVSKYGVKLLYPTGKRSTRQNEFLNSRVIKYWNTLPIDVQTAETVDCFKSRLQAHKVRSISLNPNGSSELNYWQLSTTLLYKIDDSSRDQHIEFLKDNPLIAKFKMTNLFQETA